MRYTRIGKKKAWFELSAHASKIIRNPSNRNLSSILQYLLSNLACINQPNQGQNVMISDYKMLPKIHDAYSYQVMAKVNCDSAEFLLCWTSVCYYEQQQIAVCLLLTTYHNSGRG